MLSTIALSVSLALASQAPAAPVAPTPPAGGYKLRFNQFEVANQPIATGELVAAGGRWYQFQNVDNEIIIVDPRRKRVEIIDLARKVQTDVSFERLDEATERLKNAVIRTVEKKEKEGGRANKVAAQMSRDLIEPKLSVTKSPSNQSVKLANETVQIDARGEPDADPARMAEIGVVLSSLVKLDALRNPTKIPPFPQLLAISELTNGLKLRPIELTYVYRLAGKPVKYRSLYAFEPHLTEREVQAIGKIIQLQALAKFQRFETFERDR